MLSFAVLQGSDIINSLVYGMQWNQSATRVQAARGEAKEAQKRRGMFLQLFGVNLYRIQSLSHDIRNRIEAAHRIPHTVPLSISGGLDREGVEVCNDLLQVGELFPKGDEGGLLGALH